MKKSQITNDICIIIFLVRRSVMEGKIMILSKLVVKKLYGNYDYIVKFNSDVTLIYGTNGCGKTTVLNIITSIITGSIYKLFSYNFDEIELNYYNENNKRQKKYVTLKKIFEDAIAINFQGEDTNIEKLQIPIERPRRSDSYDEIYFEEYPILSEIRKEFNFVYLALNRATALSNSEDDYYINRRRYFLEDDFIMEPERVDPEIKYIENIINRRYMNATAQINQINNEFRDSILRSALDVNIQTDLWKFLAESNLKDLEKTDIKKIRNSYLKILSNLGLVSEEEKMQYVVFFENYSDMLKKRKNNFDLKQMFSLFTSDNEMKKIEHIVEIAADTEKQKAQAMRSIELYLKTVNEFISTSDFKKKIEISLNGRVYFKTEDSGNRLSIQYLSSGEKQLLVFFAYLIFGVKDTSSGIFVVDEPELSLHLSWQKVFVKKALEVNKNVQFIFATHAPEIVGNYRDKTEKLQRIDVR